MGLPKELFREAASAGISFPFLESRIWMIQLVFQGSACNHEAILQVKASDKDITEKFRSQALRITYFWILSFMNGK